MEKRLNVFESLMIKEIDRSKVCKDELLHQ